MKFKQFLLETNGFLYHVTLSKNVDKIKKKGILPLQTSNWVQAGNKKRYGDGSIFAFEHKKDAIRWAARWDWDLNKKMGTGDVSILTFESPISDWSEDTADPLGQAGKSGKWLKRKEMVPVSAIKSSEHVTQDLIKSASLTEDRKIYSKKYSLEEVSDIKPFSKSNADDVYKLSFKDKYVIIDNKSGLGAVPHNQDILYFGLVAIMTLDDFSSLALDDQGHQDGTASEIIKLIEQGYSIGSPFLNLKETSDGGPLQVVGHEGRGRVKAIKSYLGNNIEIPIQIFVNGYRNRELTKSLIDLVKDGNILPEEFKTYTNLKSTTGLTIGKGIIKDIIK